jgi:predicted metalloprotease with PDZ domain
MKAGRRLPALYLILVLLPVTATSIAIAQRDSTPSAKPRSLTYIFDPTVTTSNTILHVTLKFQGGSQGTEEIELPSYWNGQANHLRVLSADTTISDASAANIKIVRFPPESSVVITYDLIKDWDGPLVQPLQFHTVVMPQYIEINGDNALVHPKFEKLSPVIVSFDWQKLPKDWALATSFAVSTGPEDRLQSFTGAWRYVDNALFTAGDFRIHRFQIREKPAILAIRGQWTFTDEQAITDIQKVVGIVRDFWHDYNFPSFLITLKPFDREHGSSNGTAYTNAFWMYMSSKDPFSTQLTQLSHEAFHAWNVKRMGVSPANAGDIEWFHEGFTEYYAQLLVYRAGMMELPAYLENVNRDLRNYPDSNSPYIRGRILALWLDAQIRKDSNHKSSLDNVMFDMVREADKPLTLSRILETTNRYLSPDARHQLDQAIKQRANISAPDDAALGACSQFRVSVDEVPIFDPGFDLVASKAAGRITSVREDGPAFKAGLRNGQQINGSSVYNNQPDKIAKIGIVTEVGTQTIEYYPRKTVKVPQYHVDQAAYASNPAGCRKN